jgi:uncharacterized protein
MSGEHSPDAGSFVVPLAELRRTLGSRRHLVLEGRVRDLACSGSAVPEAALLRADVFVEAILGGVSVDGTVESPWEGECRRCLSSAGGALALEVHEVYTEGGDGDETYPLGGDEVDLEPLVRDAVLLELPQAPLCSPTCLGLCPTCGKNLNEGPCGCERPQDPRWQSLDALRET